MHLNLAELEAFDRAGNLIPPTNASMYSDRPDMPASNCIDGDYHNVCHSEGFDEHQWLRVDMIADRADVGSILVTNRDSDCNNCQSRIQGGRVHITPGEQFTNDDARATALWSAEITWTAKSYEFTGISLASSCTGRAIGQVVLASGEYPADVAANDATIYLLDSASGTLTCDEEGTGFNLYCILEIWRTK